MKWTKTLILFSAMTLAVMAAPKQESQEEEDDENRPFSIGLGVLAPSYSQRLGKDGKTRLDFHQDDKGFSYTVGNGDPKTFKNFFKQYQTVKFNKPAPAPQNEVGHANNNGNSQNYNGNNQRDLANAAQTYRDSGSLTTAGVSPYGNNAGAYRGYNQGARDGAGGGAYGGVATSRNQYGGNQYRGNQGQNQGENDRRTFAGLSAIRTPEFDRFFQSGVTNNQVGSPSQQNNVHGFTRSYEGPAEGVLAFAQQPVAPRFASSYNGGGGARGNQGYGGQAAGGNYGNDYGFGQGQGQGQGYARGAAAATPRQSYGGGAAQAPQGFAGFDASGFPPIPGYDPNAPHKAEANQGHYIPQQVARAPAQAPAPLPAPARQVARPSGQGYGGQSAYPGQVQQFAFSNQGSYGPRGSYGSVGHAANQQYEVPTYQPQGGQGGQGGRQAAQQNLIGVAYGDPKNPYGGAFNYGGTITHHGGGGVAPATAPAPQQGGAAHGSGQARSRA